MNRFLGLKLKHLNLVIIFGLLCLILHELVCLNKKVESIIELGIANLDERPILETQNNTNASSSMTKEMTGKPNSILASFSSNMNATDKALLMQLIDEVDKVCKSHNITYMMYGGTLLGSFRHHDLIPWDDDLDIFVAYASRQKLRYLLENVSDEFDVVEAGVRLKFFSLSNPRVEMHSWSWPYVDISFYVDNGTHINDAAKEFVNYKYPKSICFPTHHRPLGKLMLQAPRDEYAHLTLTYDRLTRCQAHYYSHRKEKSSLHFPLSVPCKALRNIIPFVHRTRSPSGGVLESLKLKDHTIQSIIVFSPNYVITNPYTLQLFKK